MLNLAKRFLSKEDLKAVADAIALAERQTSGEIRVAIRQKKSKPEQKLSIEELARLEFTRLGMMRTTERTGILIFILVGDRQFFILADEHINDKVAPETWSEIARGMAVNFAKSEYRSGLVGAVKSVGDHLAAHFPVRNDDKNELPNSVVLS